MGTPYRLSVAINRTTSRSIQRRVAKTVSASKSAQREATSSGSREDKSSIIEVRKVIKYVIDEVTSSVQRQIWSEALIVKKRALSGFLPSHERQGSTPPFRDMGLNRQRDADDRDFWLLRPRKVCKHQVTFQ